MKRTVLSIGAIIFAFSVVFTSRVKAADIVAQVNFTAEGYDEEGWTSVKGLTKVAINLGNGLKIDSIISTGSGFVPGTQGAPESPYPLNVGGTYNYMHNIENPYIVKVCFSGFNPSKKYTFDIFSCRKAGVTDVRTSTFGIEGTGKTVSVNAVGNTTVLSLTEIVPDAKGLITLNLLKTTLQFLYVNALVIKTEDATSVGDVIGGSSEARYYPSLVKDYLTIDNLSSPCEISVFNIAGTKIMELRNGARAEIKVGMTHQKSGVYMIRVKNLENSKIQSFKVIKD